MKSILKNLRKMANEQLLAVSEEIGRELDRRHGANTVPISAKGRVQQRQKSYRRNNGSMSAPIIAVGLGKYNKRRRAA